LNTITDLWKLVLTDLEEELSAISIVTWFDEITPVKMGAAELWLYCPNSFKRSNIERFYLEAIRKSLCRRFSVDMQVRFLSDEEYADAVGKETSRRKPLRKTGRFTFESFVVGESNRMAYQTACAVAAGEDEYCNPLVLYGRPGLGKTHLLHAIAYSVSAADPDAEVVCLKGDEFTNDLVDAIREDKNAAFREKYRNADVFLMDDVQFIAGKKQTQEEFFNTFDALYQNGCSIVITMDRPPRELSRLEERIMSRFEGGLMIEIGEPEHDTRMEIIRQKAEERRLRLTETEIEYIAGRVTGSVRQLEGILNRLKAFVGSGEASLPVREIVEGVPMGKVPAITPERVIEKVSAYYSVDAKLIAGKGRTKPVMLARQVAMYIMCNGLGLSTTQVGRIMGRDHSTVCYALQSIEGRMAADPSFAEAVERIMDK